MSEFNLIPHSYAQRLARLRLQRLAMLACCVLAGVGVLGYLGLGQWVAATQANVTRLQQEQAISSRQQDTIAALNRQKVELEQQWGLLESLRSGMPAKQMMRTVESALQGHQVWFLSWNLQRAGIETEKEAAPNQTGYFIVVKRKGSGEDWRQATHMTITGQAWDHSQLSEFAQRLLGHPQIEDVRVQRTTQTFASDRQPEAVNFDLAIVFKSETEAG